MNWSFEYCIKNKAADSFLDRRQYLHIEVFVILYKKRCGHSSLVEYQLPKLRRRVRFPLSAPFFFAKKDLRRLYSSEDAWLNWREHPEAIKMAMLS